MFPKVTRLVALSARVSMLLPLSIRPTSVLLPIKLPAGPLNVSLCGASRWVVDPAAPMEIWLKVPAKPAKPAKTTSSSMFTLPLKPVAPLNRERAEAGSERRISQQKQRAGRERHVAVDGEIVRER